MRVQAMPLRCSKCGHEWEDEVVDDCSFDLAVASMFDVVKRGCPACLSKRRNTVLIRLQPAADEPSSHFHYP